MNLESRTVQIEAMLLLELHKRGTRSGPALREAYKERTGQTLRLGSLHPTLARLRKKGYVTSEEGEPSPKRGNYRTVNFDITEEGRRALARFVEQLKQLTIVFNA